MFPRIIYLQSGSRTTLILHLILILGFLDNVTSQHCHRSQAQPPFNHTCPPFSREAYTVQAESFLYQKHCCDAAGVKWSRAVVKGCIETSCLPHSYNDPCSSLPRYIVDGVYVPYKDVKRDRCPDPDWGQTAVCCPPNTEANLLMSAYGAECNEFPHQARLETEDEVCGGTVYNYNTVITAAHCVVDKHGNLKNPRDFKLTLGVNIATPGDPSFGRYVYPVERAIVHPGYSLYNYQPEFRKGKRIYNDIALLRLSRSIDFSQNIKALPIAPENFHPRQYGTHVATLGWGTADGVASGYLLKVNLLARSDDQCFKGYYWGYPYPNTYEFSTHLHCFGGTVNGEYSPAVGKGASGGPAICKGPNGYAVLCGVNSFGADVVSCRRYGGEVNCLPSVYTDVSYFRSWIQSNAGDQDWRTLSWRKNIFGVEQPWTNFPHQVKIISDTGPSDCGGTLISRDTVITSGHCVFSENRSPYNGLQVIVWGGGSYRPTLWGVVAPSNFASYKIITGLKSASLQGPTWIDNLAVIKLNDRVPISYSDIPSLPFGKDLMTSNVLELAWPADSKQSGHSLVQRSFRIFEGSECHRRLERLRGLGVHTSFRELDKFFCGVEEYSGGGVCDRLLGGGVICPGSGAGVLCGVQTFRFCDMSTPTVFLNLAYYPNIIKRSI